MQPPTSGVPAGFAGTPLGSAGLPSRYADNYVPPKSTFAPGQRKRINALAVCLNVFLPWFLFSLLYAMMSFTWHYQHPTLIWVILFASFIVPLGTGVHAYLAKRRHAVFPMWYTFATLAFLLAIALAALLGDLNFWYNMQPFYEMENMNSYPSVNPATKRGQQMMDSGRVYFAPGTALDVKKSMGFKNHDTYCVAPITNGCDKLPTYDFWAVGVNCCNGESTAFRCGDFNNPHARSGLRVIREDQHPFFRLAVKQAEAAYNIKALHPIFYYWIQDPLSEVYSYRDNGFQYFLLGVFAHLGLNLFCVVFATIAFSKADPH